jgi:hypothetical protein
MQQPVAIVIGLVVAFCVLWVLRYVDAGRRARRIRELQAQYTELGAGGEADFDRRRELLQQRTHEVHRLWTGARVPDSTFTESGVWYPGYPASPLLMTQNYSARANWLKIDEDVINYVRSAFNHAIGYYDDACRRSLNPIDTLVAILTAPQALVRWFGLSGEDALSRVLSISWTLLLVASVLAAILGVSLRDFGFDPFHAGN